MRSRSLLFTAMLVGLCVMSTDALAQSDQEIMAEQRAQLAKMGGSMQVLALGCGYATAPQLAVNKQEQLNASVARGGSAAEFNRSFNEGLSQSNAKWSAMSVTQRAQMCEQVKATVAAAMKNQ